MNRWVRSLAAILAALSCAAVGCRERSRVEAVASRATAAIDWVRIPAGSFQMGSPPDEPGRDSDEGPLRLVTLEAFEIARTEVTVAQYRACVEAGACRRPKGGFRCSYGQPGADEHPVVCVSLPDTQAFSRWVGGSLPSEAQWEYAARAGATGARYGEISEVAWWRESSRARAHRVGVKKANAWGLHDMLGNVWEFVADEWHRSYEGGPSDGSVWLTDLEDHYDWVARGGCWVDHRAWVRLASRYVFAGSARGIVGFRPVRPAR
jgi:formylglycine-generating enzyme required for sulfatase activity